MARPNLDTGWQALTEREREGVRNLKKAIRAELRKIARREVRLRALLGQINANRANRKAASPR